MPGLANNLGIESLGVKVGSRGTNDIHIFLGALRLESSIFCHSNQLKILAEDIDRERTSWC